MGTALIDTKVVQSNALIKAQKNMNLNKAKLFRALIAAINTNDPKDYVIVNRRELIDVFDKTSTSTYGPLKDAFKSLKENDGITVVDSNGNMAEINLIKMAVWNIKGEPEVLKQEKNYISIEGSLLPEGVELSEYDVFVQFEERLMPHLIHLKTNFTQYYLSEIMQLQSCYSILLFEYLMMIINKYKAHVIEISLDSLRAVFKIEDDKYIEFRDFNKRILKPTTEELTRKTNIWVTFDTEKRNRKVDKIIFYVLPLDFYHAPHGSVSERQEHVKKVCLNTEYEVGKITMR